MTWIIGLFVFIGKTARFTLKSWDLGIMWWGVSLRWKCISDEEMRISCGIFWKTTAKTTPKKESVVKRNNPFATTITWLSRYRESRAISLVQLRLLQGSQQKEWPPTRVVILFVLIGCGIGIRTGRGSEWRASGTSEPRLTEERSKAEIPLGFAVSRRERIPIPQKIRQVSTCRIFYPSRRLGISSPREAWCISSAPLGLYLITRQRASCLRLDDIQHFVLVICNSFGIDDIHGYAVILRLSSKPY